MGHWERALRKSNIRLSRTATASARLAAKFGPAISLRDVTDSFSGDCLWRSEARRKRGVSACGIYLPDLEQPRQPDAPHGMLKLRLVKNK
jgi:hypothetical protein